MAITTFSNQCVRIASRSFQIEKPAFTPLPNRIIALFALSVNLLTSSKLALVFKYQSSKTE